MRIEERERVCLEVIRKLPERYVLVGGYAVSAFEFPRFSVDLDMLIRATDLEEFSGILKNDGFSLVKEAEEFALVYSGKFVRLQRMVESLPVSVDLLLNMVQCRQTDASYSFDYIWKHSEIRVVTGFGVRASAQARVADREMLMALKINSMKMADQKDIIALCGGKVDTSRVADHLKRAPSGKIREYVGRLLSYLDNPKSRDSLSGVFVFSASVLEGLLKRTQKTLAAIDEKLSDKKVRGRALE